MKGVSILVLVLGLMGCLRRSDDAKLQATDDMGAMDAAADASRPRPDMDASSADVGLPDDAAIDRGTPASPTRCEFAGDANKILFPEPDSVPDLRHLGSQLLTWSPAREAFVALAVDNRMVDRPLWIELRISEGPQINTVVGAVSPVCLNEACPMGEDCHFQGITRNDETGEFLVALGRYGANPRAQVLVVPNTLDPIDCDAPACEVSMRSSVAPGGHPERVSNPLLHDDGSFSIAWEPEDEGASYLARCTDEQSQFNSETARVFPNNEVTRRQALAPHDPRLLIAAYNNSGIEDPVRVLTLTEVEPSAIAPVGSIEARHLQGVVPDGLQIAIASDDRIWMLASEGGRNNPDGRYRLMHSNRIGPDNSLNGDEWQLRSAKDNDIRDVQMVMTGDGPALGWFDATQEKLIFSWLNLDGDRIGTSPESAADPECSPSRIEMAWNGLAGVDARFGLLWACGAQGLGKSLWYQEVRCYAVDD